MDEKWSWIEGSHELRDEILQALSDADLAYSPGGDNMPIGELEGGVEYGQTVGRSWLFGQVALVGQEWFGAGSASRSSTDIIPGGKASVSSNFSTTSHVGDSDLAFFGLLLRAGVNY